MGEGVVDSEGGDKGMGGNEGGGMERMLLGILNDNNVIVIVIVPRQSASCACGVANCDMHLLVC